MEVTAHLLHGGDAISRRNRQPEVDVVVGLEAGADGYIPRPIENRELLARVQAMVRIQQAETALRHARAFPEDGRVRVRLTALRQPVSLRARRPASIAGTKRRSRAHVFANSAGEIGRAHV